MNRLGKGKGLVYYSVTSTKRASHFWLMKHRIKTGIKVTTSILSMLYFFIGGHVIL
jgi:hypothetical protein